MANEKLSKEVREFTEKIIKNYLEWKHIKLSLKTKGKKKKFYIDNADKITKNAGIYCMVDVETKIVLRIGKATNENGIYGRWIKSGDSHEHAINGTLNNELYKKFFRVVKDKEVYLLWAETPKDLAVPIEQLLIALFNPVFEEYKKEWGKIKNKKEFKHKKVIEDCFEKRKSSQKTIKLDGINIKY